MNYAKECGRLQGTLDIVNRRLASMIEASARLAAAAQALIDAMDIDNVDDNDPILNELVELDDAAGAVRSQLWLIAKTSTEKDDG